MQAKPNLETLQRHNVNKKLDEIHDKQDNPFFSWGAPVDKATNLLL